MSQRRQDWTPPARGLLVVAAALLACQGGTVTPQADAVVAEAPKLALDLLGRRALLRPPGDAPRLVFDAKSVPTLRSTGAFPEGLRLHWHHAGDEVSLVLSPPDPRGDFVLRALELPTAGLPVGDAELSVAGQGGARQSWAVRWDEPPESRSGLVALRASLVGKPGEAADAALAAALPTLEPLDRLWAQIDLARLRARNEPRRAEQAWHEAAEGARAIHAPSEVSRRLRAAARFALWDRRFDRALALLDESEAVDQAAGDAAFSPGTALHRAQVLERRGDFAAADALLQGAAERLRGLGLDLDWAGTLQQRAGMLGDSGSIEEARALMDTAAAWYAAHPGSPGGGAELDQNRGWLLLTSLLAEGAPLEPARVHCEAAFERLGRPGAEGQAADMAACLAMIALRSTPPDPAVASQWLNRARRLQLATVDELLPLLDVLEGERLLALGRPRDAARQLREGLESRVGREVEGVSDTSWRTHELLARAALALGDQRGARLAFEAAFRALESLARRTAVQSARGHFLADRRGLFDSALDLELALGRPEAAWAITERAAAPVLRAVAARSLVARLSAKERAEWEVRLQGLLSRRDAFEGDRRAGDLMTTSDRAVWQKARTATATTLARDFDASFQWLSDRTGAQSPSDLRVPTLQADETLLMYHERARGTGTDVFTVRAGTVVHRRLATLAWSDVVESIPKSGHVYVVTGGDPAVRTLFEAQLAGGLPGIPAETTLSLVPYASLLSGPETDPQRASGPALIVGDPNGNLPHARAESEAVGRHLPGATVLMGASATRASVLAAWARPTVFHFAGHGVLSGRSPWDASLRVAGDAAISLTDVLASQPHPGLVVLSGCETAQALAVSGRERVGLPEAFLLDGTRTVLASVRRIDDSETVEYMKRFYAGGGMDHPAATWRRLLREDEVTSPGKATAISHAFLPFGRR